MPQLQQRCRKRRIGVHIDVTGVASVPHESHRCRRCGDAPWLHRGVASRSGDDPRRCAAPLAVLRRRLNLSRVPLRCAAVLRHVVLECAVWRRVLSRHLAARIRFAVAPHRCTALRPGMATSRGVGAVQRAAAGRRNAAARRRRGMQCDGKVSRNSTRRKGAETVQRCGAATK